MMKVLLRFLLQIFILGALFGVFLFARAAPQNTPANTAPKAKGLAPKKSPPNAQTAAVPATTSPVTTSPVTSLASTNSVTKNPTDVAKDNLQNIEQNQSVGAQSAVAPKEDKKAFKTVQVEPDSIQGIFNPSSSVQNKESEKSSPQVQGVLSPVSPPESFAILQEKLVTDTIDSEQQKYNREVGEQIQRGLSRDLALYCGEYCRITDMRVSSREVFNPVDSSLGFESVENPMVRSFQVVAVTADVFVNSTYGSENFSKLKDVLLKIVQNYSYNTFINWSFLEFPTSNAEALSDYDIKLEFLARLRSQIEIMIGNFCPEDCKVIELDVTVKPITLSEANLVPAQRYLRSHQNQGGLLVTGVKAKIALNRDMPSKQRVRIQDLFRQTLEPYGVLTLSFQSLPFPKSFREALAEQEEERTDPYGVNKLKALLSVLKDYLRTPSSKEITKEIYRTNSTNMTKDFENKTSDHVESNEKDSSEIKHFSEVDKQIANTDQVQKNNSLSWLEWSLIAGMLLTTILVIWLLSGRFLRGTRGMVEEAIFPEEKKEDVKPKESPFTKKILLRELRDELFELLIKQPKVAKQVFTKLLKDSKMEEVAKYCMIFGEVPVFELLKDPDLKKDIALLAEYIEVNLPTVSEDEEFTLLKELKIKLTAGRIQVMNGKTFEVFDFLKVKTPKQVFELIFDETPKTQGVVLGQLPSVVRKEVFNYFKQDAQNILLKELANNIDPVSKEYLYAISEMLKKKGAKVPGFSGESSKGFDVLLQLLEQSNLDEQREIVRNIDETQPEVGRMVRDELVSLELLPLLKEGLLLEVFLSLDPKEVSLFLNKIDENLKSDIAMKLPKELADNWILGAEVLTEGSNQEFQTTVNAVIAKIKEFSTSGLINLKDMNEYLYPIKEEMTAEIGMEEEAKPKEII